MSRKSKREIERVIEDLGDVDGDDDTVLVIGGNPDRAGVMSEEEYREEYAKEERARHVTCDAVNEREESET
jgi:PHD/YefM family antitoxin component YafN of YafNO toxin-antitoxin module